MKTTREYTKRIFSRPTAPFRETWVLNEVAQILNELKLPYVTDSSGNLIAGVRNLKELKNSRKVALVAHTDHPGFHLLAKKKGLWRARWYGGCPPKMANAPLAIYHPQFPGMRLCARSASATLDKKKEFSIKILSKDFIPDATCFGAFDYPGYSKKGSRITTRVADDLAGVVIILSTLSRLNSQARKSFVGIFTRAEEVGFVGALGFIFDKSMGAQNRVISLEASSQRVGARVGKGPIVRLGDRKTLFDTEMISLLDKAAKNKKHQRRIMDGGSCEATAFNAFGIRAAGLAVPLGNYHNQRPSGRPGPEFIDENDLHGAVLLCTEFYQNLKKKKAPGDLLREDLKKRFKEQLHLLKGAQNFV